MAPDHDPVAAEPKADRRRALAAAAYRRIASEGFEGLKIIGSRFSPDAHRLRDFAARNAIPFTWIDLETDQQAENLLREFGVPASATPVVLTRDGHYLANPSFAEIGRCAGLAVALDPAELHDLIVVGAGPAGLAAAVYAASEGLDVLVIERMASGGQAGTSSRIVSLLWSETNRFPAASAQISMGKLKAASAPDPAYRGATAAFPEELQVASEARSADIAAADGEQKLVASLEEMATIAEELSSAKTESGRRLAIQYAVMLALIIVVCITSITALGTNANKVFSNVALNTAVTSS